MRMIHQLNIGEAAPDFTLKDAKKNEVSLSSFKGKQNVLLAFFPLAFTPVWQAELSAYHADMQKFADYNTQVLGISTDSLFTLAAFSEKCGGLGFPLLSDFWPHGQVSLTYGVLRAEGFPQRSVFIIDKQGNLNWVKLYELQRQPDNEELLAILRKLWMKWQEGMKRLIPDSQEHTSPW